MSVHGTSGSAPIDPTQATHVKKEVTRPQLATIEKTNTIAPPNLTDQGDATALWTDSPVSQPIPRDVKHTPAHADPGLRELTNVAKKNLKTIKQAPQFATEGRADHPDKMPKTNRKKG